jgi:branched-chain amino acid transport system substrate-binding protein
MTSNYRKFGRKRGVSRTTALIAAIVVIVIVVGAAYYFFMAPPEVVEEIRIGIAGPLEYIHGIGHMRGAEMAAEEINANGGVIINGVRHEVKLFFEDTREADPTIPVEEGVAAITRLVTVSKVHAIIGGFRSDVVLAMQEEAVSRKVPFIVAGASANAITDRVAEDYDKYKYTFRVTPTNSTTLAKAYLEFYKYVKAEYGLTKVYILAEDALWTHLMVDNVLLPYLPLLGFEIVDDPTYVPLGARDMSSEMTDIINSGAELIAHIFSGDVGIVFTKYWSDMKVPALPLGINVYSQLDIYWEQTEGKANYETTMTDIGSINTPIGEAFFNAYVEKYGESPVYTAPGTYIAVYLVVEAIKQAQSLEADDIVAALEEIGRKGIMGDELAPLGNKMLYKFTRNHDIQWGVDDPNKGVILVLQQWQDGERIAVWPPAAATGTLKLPER